jgi:hypothetical protein
MLDTAPEVPSGVGGGSASGTSGVSADECVEGSAADADATSDPDRGQRPGLDRVVNRLLVHPQDRRDLSDGQELIGARRRLGSAVHGRVVSRVGGGGSELPAVGAGG